ncbi:MAG: LD-carboxypeptidase [Clostridiales bacterium]|nr:LD-carboxypeptidase [Clostridiales bacterium]
MIIPDYIKKGDTIGVTAPSGGVEKQTDRIRFLNAKKKLNELGYEFIFTPNVFQNDSKGRSGSARERAKQFMELIADKKVKYIVSAKGGDYLMEILPYLDFDVIRHNPKWIQGYSDNTGLVFNIPLLCDIATVYGNNFGDYGMEEWHESVCNNLKIIQGENIIQHNFDFYESMFKDKVTGLEGYENDEKVELKIYNGGKESADFSGRLIGGCLDVVMDMAGTKYALVREFIEKYKSDGIVWYFESFANNSEGIVRNMWKLKEMGWFENTTGIVFGREMFYEKFTETEFDEAAMMVLESLEVPVIFGADIGHKPPQMTMINGAVSRFTYSDGKLEYEYKGF